MGLGSFGGRMNILALDLGTNCGWALHVRGGTISGGTVRHVLRRGEQPGQKWISFRTQLIEHKRAAGEIHAIYYEDVKRHVGVLAAHAYGGFLANLEMWCAVNNVRMVPVGVGVIKKYWTGKGNADKGAMIAEAKSRGFTTVDENHADALAILSLALEMEGLIEKVAA